MTRYRVSMTFDVVTDCAGAVETTAREAFQETADLAERLGSAAQGIESNAVILGLCALLAEALAIGVQRKLPGEPQVKGLGVSAQEVVDDSLLS